MEPNMLILVTHLFAIFPLIVFLWSWKRRRDAPSLYTLQRFVFCVSYSIFYHTYHVSSIETIKDHQDRWSFLDGFSSTSLIFSTCCYGLRVREPQFYITTSLADSIILLMYMFSMWYNITWMIILMCIIVTVFKWRTVYRYFAFFPCLSACTLLCAGMATWCFLEAVVKDFGEGYMPWHSAWHAFIFSTAGFLSCLRYRLDDKLYPIRTRETLDSI